MGDSLDARSNRLLAAFSEDEWQRCMPHLESVELHAGQHLYEPGKPGVYVFFPTSAVVSLLYWAPSYWLSPVSPPAPRNRPAAR